MAANSAVTLPFTFNGEEFVFGRVRFNVDSMARVDGFDFSVPAKYALMLLSGNDGAWHFLEAVAKAPVLNEIKTGLLERALNEGLAYTLRAMRPTASLGSTSGKTAISEWTLRMG